MQDNQHADQRAPRAQPPPVVMPTAEELQQIEVEADIRDSKTGLTMMISGGIIFVIGTAATVGTFVAASSAGGGTYVIAWGAVLFGLADFVIGFQKWSLGRKHK